jgi:uncharacterized protein YjbJ (UPF0337 family)
MPPRLGRPTAFLHPARLEPRSLTKRSTSIVNWNQLEGKWKQLRGNAKQHWGKLTDDDLTVINGSRDRLIGKIQERYGYAQEEAQRRADEWMRTVEEEPAMAGSSRPPFGTKR